MNELCDAWNEIKKRIIAKSRVIFCKPRQIWWCSIGMNIGTEIYGKNHLFERPVLILKMYGHATAFVAPLTTKNHDNRYSVRTEYQKRIYYVVLSQVRTISTKRFSRKIRRLSCDEFETILSEFKDSI
jgi:mRNA interferase MazF